MKKVVIIGGGHAGLEAANAVGKLGLEAILVTLDATKIATAPCNPSIGGPAKGNVVREIDALGGLMGNISDLTMIQIKKLNRSKGPAVQAIRAQIDKEEYSKKAQELLSQNENVIIKEGMAKKIITENKKVVGVEVDDEIIKCTSVIITTGTYMNSYIIKGNKKIFSGPEDMPTSTLLSDNLLELGFKLLKLKTGTPARVKKDSIDFTNLELSPGDKEKIKFSHFKNIDFDYNNQEDCYLIHTNQNTHDIILNNLDASPITSGIIEGVGARYCPSIEDKLLRFSDKKRHQIFLEPEGRNSNSIYVQGFSTSMPEHIQEQMIHSLPGMDKAEIIKYGYAIEYEAIYPEQLKNTLESKLVENLYFAGQVNGTSGYEEAAGQGILAGINAGLKILKKEPLILSRSNSYIGLMIDDLVTKGTKEPYRLLTSRAEYRLILRNDNADTRLTPLAYEAGMIDEEVYQLFLTKQDKINQLMEFSKDYDISPKQITDQVAQELNTTPLKHGLKLIDFIKRPNIKYCDLASIIELPFIDEEVFEIAEIEIKYSGYLKKIDEEIKRFQKNEKLKIPTNIEYKKIDNLALEAREKLDRIKPQTIGQASRISGITPADISILLMVLKEKKLYEH